MKVTKGRRTLYKYSREQWLSPNVNNQSHIYRVYDALIYLANEENFFSPSPHTHTQSLLIIIIIMVYRFAQRLIVFCLCLSLIDCVHYAVVAGRGEADAMCGCVIFSA
jgi:hypothetical protein